MMDKSNVEKRSEILEAALNLFSKKGFDGATVDEIAAKAGVGKGTIYLYFRTKEAIFWTGVEEGLSRLQRLFEQIAREKDYLEQLRQMIRVFFDFVENNQDLFKILYKEHTNLPKKDDVRNRLFQIHLDIQQYVTCLIQEGIAQNILRQGEPKYFSAAFIGILSQLAFHWLLNDRAESLSAMEDTALTLLLTGIKNEKINDHPGGAFHVS